MSDNFELPKVEEVTVVETNEVPVELVTVEQVTQDLLKQQEDQKPEDVAAHFFQMYLPIYKNLLSGLSNKDARRVAEHVVQWPLETQEPKFNEDNAKQAFLIGKSLLDAKMIMRSVVELERAQKILAEKAKQEEAAKMRELKKQESEANEKAFELKGEENNG